MAFPTAFIDELIARNPIEEVVGQYVSLSRKGANLFGLCPFHSEKTASFSVQPEKGIFYCFGCHKGGGVVQFAMEIENLDYPDAVRWLAKRAGMEVPEDGVRREGYHRQERLKELCRDAARYFHAQLSLDGAKPARDYLAKRQVSAAIVTRFGLGYAPDGWSGLKDAMQAKGYTEQELLIAGLAVKHPTKGTVYDRFRNRLMFPIIDVRGSVIGFGGRVLDNSEPKYLNSSETPIFNKRKNLFALNYAKKSKEDMIILTEGYMDAISLHQFGFDCAVASLGTALTEEHANLLAKYTHKVVLTYDSDAPGQNATRRAAPILEKAGLAVQILKMEGAKDPDEFLKAYGADAFRGLLNRSENPTEYMLAAMQRKFDLTRDDQKIAFLREAAVYLAGLPNAVERELYTMRAAEAAGVSPEAVKTEVNKAYRRNKLEQKKREERKNLEIAGARQPLERTLHYKNLRSAMAEEGLLRLLLREPDLFEQVKLTPEQFSSPLLGRVFGVWREEYGQGRAVGIAALGEGFTKEEIAHLSGVIQKEQNLVSETALKDYVSVIREEYEKTQSSPEDRLRQAQERKRREK